MIAMSYLDVSRLNCVGLPDSLVKQRTWLVAEMFMWLLFKIKTESSYPAQTVGLQKFLPQDST